MIGELVLVGALTALMTRASWNAHKREMAALGKATDELRFAIAKEPEYDAEPCCPPHCCCCGPGDECCDCGATV